MSVMATGDRTVVGYLVGLEPRNGGWMRFSIKEEGRQFPIKADTKKPEIIAQCQALMGQLVSAQLNESPSQNINPNTGQPYTNRYLNQIAFAQPGTVAPQAQPQAMQQQYAQYLPQAQQQAQLPQGNGQPQAMVTRDQAERERTRELRIMREAASKAAVMMMPVLPEEQRNPVGLIEAAEMWVAYFAFGPTRFGVAPFNSAPEAAQQALSEARQAHEDPNPIDDPADHMDPYAGLDGQNINRDSLPCPACGAAPGQLHADDCLPY